MLPLMQKVWLPGTGTKSKKMGPAVARVLFPSNSNQKSNDWSVFPFLIPQPLPISRYYYQPNNNGTIGRVGHDTEDGEFVPAPGTWWINIRNEIVSAPIYEGVSFSFWCADTNKPGTYIMVFDDDDFISDDEDEGFNRSFSSGYESDDESGQSLKIEDLPNYEEEFQDFKSFEIINLDKRSSITVDCLVAYFREKETDIKIDL